MGGAMAMLAALDFAHTQPKLRPVSTYTFAAPRVGDSRFARLFSATFPRKRHLGALQVASDAVPPWGFEHPDGVAVLADDDDHQPCGAVGTNPNPHPGPHPHPHPHPNPNPIPIPNRNPNPNPATHGSGGGSEPCLR